MIIEIKRGTLKYKTSGPYFHKYGKTISKMDLDRFHILNKYSFSVDQSSIEIWYSYTEDVYIQCTAGIAFLFITKDVAKAPEQFVIHGITKINKGMYFNLISGTQYADLDFYYPKNTKVISENIDPIVLERNTVEFTVSEVYCSFYNVKEPGYQFAGESHSYLKLTYVDSGELTTHIDGQKYVLKKFNIILYKPGTFHTQSNQSNKATRYLSIMFDTSGILPKEIFNHIFQVNREQLVFINEFLRNSENDLINRKRMMVTLLNTLIVSLIGEPFIPSNKPINPTSQYFEHEILGSITTYINENIYTNISIDDLCKKFSISRSSLQKLFKNNLMTSPKKYINDLKLSKSKLLIRENKYTISEIASMMSYNSIHYFSRAFSHKFHISPSEYAKVIYKDK